MTDSLTKSDPLTTFVVGPNDAPIEVRFVLVWKDGSPNIEALDLLPPLNRTGLLRLSKVLVALADLIEYGHGWRTSPEAKK